MRILITSMTLLAFGALPSLVCAQVATEWEVTDIYTGDLPPDPTIVWTPPATEGSISIPEIDGGPGVIDGDLGANPFDDGGLSANTPEPSTLLLSVAAAALIQSLLGRNRR